MSSGSTSSTPTTSATFVGREQVPDPVRMQAELARTGKMVTIIDPHLVDDGYPVFQQAKEQNLLVRLADD